MPGICDLSDTVSKSGSPEASNVTKMYDPFSKYPIPPSSKPTGSGKRISKPATGTIDSSRAAFDTISKPSSGTSSTLTALKISTTDPDVSNEPLANTSVAPKTPPCVPPKERPGISIKPVSNTSAITDLLETPPQSYYFAATASSAFSSPTRSPNASTPPSPKSPSVEFWNKTHYTSFVTTKQRQRRRSSLCYSQSLNYDDPAEIPPQHTVDEGYSTVRSIGDPFSPSTATSGSFDGFQQNSLTDSPLARRNPTKPFILQKPTFMLCDSCKIQVTRPYTEAQASNLSTALESLAFSNSTSVQKQASPESSMWTNSNASSSLPSFDKALRNASATFEESISQGPHYQSHREQNDISQFIKPYPERARLSPNSSSRDYESLFSSENSVSSYYQANQRRSSSLSIQPFSLSTTSTSHSTYNISKSFNMSSNLSRSPLSMASGSFFHNQRVPSSFHMHSHLHHHTSISRSRSNSQSLGRSYSNSPLYLNKESLVGSYEESLLSGRMSAPSSPPVPFYLKLGVLGVGSDCPPSLRTPKHVTTQFDAVFYDYDLHETGIAGRGSPYVGVIDLEKVCVARAIESQKKVDIKDIELKKKERNQVLGTLFQKATNSAGPLQSSNHHVEKVRKKSKSKSKSSGNILPFPGYRIPPKGKLQIIILNPQKTAVKLFLIPYDLTNLNIKQKTFLRYKVFAKSAQDKASETESSSSTNPQNVEESGIPPQGSFVKQKGYLLQAAHLQFARPSRNKFYLYGDLRLVFHNRADSNIADMSDKTSGSSTEPSKTPTLGFSKSRDNVTVSALTGGNNELRYDVNEAYFKYLDTVKVDNEGEIGEGPKDISIIQQDTSNESYKANYFGGNQSGQMLSKIETETTSGGWTSSAVFADEDEYGDNTVSTPFSQAPLLNNQLPTAPVPTSSELVCDRCNMLLIRLGSSQRSCQPPPPFTFSNPGQMAESQFESTGRQELDMTLMNDLKSVSEKSYSHAPGFI